jgi:hypothetical protein
VSDLGQRSAWSLWSIRGFQNLVRLNTTHQSDQICLTCNTHTARSAFHSTLHVQWKWNTLISLPFPLHFTHAVDPHSTLRCHGMEQRNPWWSSIPFGPGLVEFTSGRIHRQRTGPCQAAPFTHTMCRCPFKFNTVNWTLKPIFGIAYWTTKKNRSSKLAEEWNFSPVVEMQL